MSQSRKSKRPAPDAYDQLWSLLPVYIAFFVTLVLVAATNGGHSAER
jgi:hypothetical protein